MRFGHYTVFDTLEENKHTQVYVEYDVPNKDNLDGATGTMILSDGGSDSSGGDSRFSTCEVEIFFTKNGQPMTFTVGEVVVSIGCTAGSLTNVDDPLKDFYVCLPMIKPGNNTINPLMFDGAAYLCEAHVVDGNNTFYMINWEVEPVCTGDISFGTFADGPAVIIKGNGTITIEMIVD